MPAFATPFFFGAVAQLEERHNGIVEVVGSIPIGSTNLGKLMPKLGNRAERWD